MIAADPTVLMLIVAGVLLYWAGAGVKDGVDWTAHKVKAGIHKIVHPHEKKDSNDGQEQRP